MDFPIKNGDFPIKNGDFPMKNGDFPIKNGDFPTKNCGSFHIATLNYQRVPHSHDLSFQQLRSRQLIPPGRQFVPWVSSESLVILFMFMVIFFGDFNVHDFRDLFMNFMVILNYY